MYVFTCFSQGVHVEVNSLCFSYASSSWATDIPSNTLSKLVVLHYSFVSIMYISEAFQSRWGVNKLAILVHILTVALSRCHTLERPTVSFFSSFCTSKPAGDFITGLTFVSLFANLKKNHVNYLEFTAVPFLACLFGLMSTAWTSYIGLR